MIAVALLAAAAAMVLVRLGWGGRRGIAAAGWLALGATLTALTLRDGAWGLAVGTVAAIASALTMVLYAGWTSPAKALRPARQAPSVTIPLRAPDLARRFAVFVLAVPCAFAAAQWLAFGLQSIARRGGMGDANAIVLALFLQPVLWGIILTVQMTRAGPGQMIAPPAFAAVLGTLLWSAS